MNAGLMDFLHPTNETDELIKKIADLEHTICVLKEDNPYGYQLTMLKQLNVYSGLIKERDKTIELLSNQSSLNWNL